MLDEMAVSRIGSFGRIALILNLIGFALIITVEYSMNNTVAVFCFYYSTIICGLYVTMTGMWIYITSFTRITVFQMIYFPLLISMSALIAFRGLLNFA